MDATCKVQDNIHVFRLVHNMCPGFWVHIIMRWALKIILFPIILILSILIAFLKFIIKVSGMILGIISFLVFIGAVACFIQKDMATGIAALLLAFLISPYGLPKIALWITAYLEVAKDTLKEI